MLTIGRHGSVMEKRDLSDVYFENCTATARELREQLWPSKTREKKDKVEKHPLFGSMGWKLIAYLFLATSTASAATAGAVNMNEQIGSLYTSIDRELGKVLGD